MTPRSGRLLALLQLLQQYRTPVTAKTLADRLSVSERTIYRDMALLSELGAPIEGAAGLGYRLGDGFFLPPLHLTRGEADAVLLGLRFVMRRGDADLARSAKEALGKIAGSLDPDRKTAMETNGLTVGPSTTGASPPGTTERIGLVRETLLAEHKLRITYRDGEDRLTERTIWPVALGFFDSVEVLVAWCEERDAFRHFRLDRMITLDRRPDRLPLPRRILLAQYKIEEPEANL